jgi:poly(hydroxyalkanoate) depolymerase family esterase
MARRAVAVMAACAVVLALTGGGRATAGTFTDGRHAGRAYRVFVPDGAASTERTLVVALHGCGQTADDFARGTRLNAAAARRDLIVVYPQQTRSGNPGRCWNWFDPRHQGRDRGETAEILAIARDVRQRHRVRPGALVLGLSSGGFMAINLVCAAPGEWKGVGTMAGGPYRCGIGMAGAMACMKGRPMDAAASAAACVAATGARPRNLRAALWHGSTDRVVDPANLDGLAAMLARLLGASRQRSESAGRAEYVDAAGVVRIETRRVPGLGHAWSGGDPAGSYTDPNGPDATAEMLQFLLVGGPDLAPYTPRPSPRPGGAVPRLYLPFADRSIRPANGIAP